MASRVYKVSDLRDIIKESVNEFEPMKGKNVDKENKANNEKAYSETAKRTKSYDGGAKKDKKKSYVYPNTPNKGMQDLQYDTPVPESVKKNVASQMKGYTSAENEKLHKKDETPLDYVEMDGMKERAVQNKKNRDTATEIGLTGRQLNTKDVEKLRDTVFESKAVRYKYKQTVFLNEEHMLVKLPDEAKREGKKCIMEDAKGTTYYVVWHDENPEVLNKTRVNEQANKIMNLIDYKSEPIHTTNKMRVNENAMVADMMNKVRRLMAENK